MYLDEDKMALILKKLAINIEVDHPENNNKKSQHNIDLRLDTNVKCHYLYHAFRIYFSNKYHDFKQIMNHLKGFCFSPIDNIG